MCTNARVDKDKGWKNVREMIFQCKREHRLKAGNLSLADYYMSLLMLTEK